MLSVYNKYIFKIRTLFGFIGLGLLNSFAFKLLGKISSKLKVSWSISFLMSGFAISLQWLFSKNITYWLTPGVMLANNAVITKVGNKKISLENIVAKVAKKMNLPIPTAWIIKKDYINAFATGPYPSCSAVAVTTGMIKIANKIEQALTYLQKRKALTASNFLDRLGYEKNKYNLNLIQKFIRPYVNHKKSPQGAAYRWLTAILYHELGHIKNYDISLSCVANTAVQSINLSAHILADIMKKEDKQKNKRAPHNNKYSKEQIFLIYAFNKYIIGGLASLFSLFISRSKEYAADRKAVEFGQGEELLEAFTMLKLKEKNLEKMMGLSNHNNLINCYANHYHKSTNNSFITWFKELFSTHPHIENREQAINDALRNS